MKMNILVLSLLACVACAGGNNGEAAEAAAEEVCTESAASVQYPCKGSKYVDFSVEYDGKTVRLSDFIGGANKLTVVDFWASWCRPCRAEIPYLKQVYEDYHAKGVQVVGVATWDKPEDTFKAIKDLGIAYPQIINAQTIGSDAYGIQGIPMIILINAEGTIVGYDLRGAEIEAAVKKNLGE